MEMQARLKNLKNIKNQFQNKHQHNLTKIEFLNNIKKRVLDINPLLVRNIKSIKKMAKENGITVRELIMMLKDEQ